MTGAIEGAIRMGDGGLRKVENSTLLSAVVKLVIIFGVPSIAGLGWALRGDLAAIEKSITGIEVSISDGLKPRVGAVEIGLEQMRNSESGRSAIRFDKPDAAAMEQRLQRQIDNNRQRIERVERDIHPQR
jgi:hypothetical protein